MVFTKSRGRYYPILKTPHDEYHPDISKRSALAQYHDWLPMMQMDNSRSRYSLEQWNDFRHGRHYYITRVSCVPNEKKLPPIDGFQRSSNSSLPEFATWDDMWNNRKLFSNRSHPLAEGQVLKSTGMSSFALTQTNTNALSIKIIFLRSSAPILSYPGSLNYGPRRR